MDAINFKKYCFSPDPWPTVCKRSILSPRQIAEIMLNTEGIYESIQGIAGSDAFSVDQLELGGDPSLSLEDGE